MPQQNFLRSIPKGFLRVPLRVALVVPFILQISSAVGLTAFLSLKNGQKAVNDVATQLRNELTARIHQHVTAYIEIPQLVTQMNANSVHIGKLSLKLSLSQLSEFLHSLKIGRSGKTFIIEHSGDLVATSTTEQPFILSNEGGKKINKRLKAIASSDRITRLTTQYLQSQFGNLRNISSSQQLEFEIDQKRQFVQLMPFRAECGLNWVIIVVVPEADFMEHIEANTRTTILLCFVALILATAIGVITSHWISEPILCLSFASKEIANGKLDQTVAVGGINELRVLAQAHNQMATQLQDSFAGLLEANRQLEAEINERKQVEEQLRHNAFHDALTGLPNRAFFMESLKHTLQRAKRQKNYPECVRSHQSS